MWRRALLIVVGLMFAAIVGVGLFVVLGPADPITERSLGRIQPGMTRGEVDAVFTKPPGVYSTPRSRKATMAPRLYDFPPDHTHESWRGDEGEAVVVFDQQGRVVDRFFNEFTNRESLLDRLRGWLRL